MINFCFLTFYFFFHLEMWPMWAPHPLSLWQLAFLPPIRMWSSGTLWHLPVAARSAPPVTMVRGHQSNFQSPKFFRLLFIFILLHFSRLKLTFFVLFISGGCLAIAPVGPSSNLLATAGKSGAIEVFDLRFIPLETSGKFHKALWTVPRAHYGDSFFVLFVFSSFFPLNFLSTISYWFSLFSQNKNLLKSLFLGGLRSTCWNDFVVLFRIHHCCSLLSGNFSFSDGWERRGSQAVGHCQLSTIVQLAKSPWETSLFECSGIWGNHSGQLL